MTDNYYRVKYLPVEQFITMCNNRDLTADNVYIMDYGPDNIKIPVYTDRNPKYWTSADDEYIIFDSYDSAVESRVSASKTEVYATLEPTLVMDNTTLIDLPSNLMSYLQATVEARCFAFLKQQVNPKSEQREARQRIRSMRSKWRHQRLNHEGPNYGKR